MPDNRAVEEQHGSLTSPLQQQIAADIAAAGGWIGFDRFMHLALYAPGLGYYAHGSRKFGTLPQSGSDFATAPEMSPLFGHTLAQPVAEALAHTGTDAIWEFGAGSGALAEQLLGALGETVRRYTIVDISGSLRARQQERLAGFGGRVQWAGALPERIDGVVLGNEVLDAVPVQLLARLGGRWHERGVALHQGRFHWADTPTLLRPPIDVPGAHDYVTEINLQAAALVATVAARLGRGAAFFVDYGFPAAEYYHPQRHMGTLVCHRAHTVDADPLADVGSKDITAHIDFTAMALAAQDAGCSVLGYTSQAHFLLNAGLTERLAAASQVARMAGHRLVAEHEMGELFKVLCFARGAAWEPAAFAHGDRTHRL